VLEFLSLFVVGMAAVEDSWFSSAKQGRQDDLQELVSQISSVNIQDSPLGNSALHYSSQSGHIDCIKVLLKAGANVNLQNKTGETPLHKASWRGNLEAIQLLVEHGANVTIRVIFVWTSFALFRNSLFTFFLHMLSLKLRIEQTRSNPERRCKEWTDCRATETNGAFVAG